MASRRWSCPPIRFTRMHMSVLLCHIPEMTRVNRSRFLRNAVPCCICFEQGRFGHVLHRQQYWSEAVVSDDWVLELDKLPP